MNAANSPTSVTPIDHPWRVVLGVGGLCWLIVLVTSLAWALPYSGTLLMGGEFYVASSGSRILQHLIAFSCAAVCYRLALALGWPSGAWIRTRTILLNILLALTVVALMPGITALSIAVVDHRVQDAVDSVRIWASLRLSWAGWASPLRAFLPAYALGLVSIWLVIGIREQQRALLATADLQRKVSETELAMLTAQLQPHFLFNALHAVTDLIDTNPGDAKLMVVRLGDFLRHAIESSRSGWVDVATELAAIDAYLAVQQVRFGQRLRVSIAAAPATLELRLPSMLLQPLVENAIEHGRLRLEDECEIRVEARLEARELIICVRNSVPRLEGPIDPAQYGNGLSNVARRLQSAYGARATLRVGPESGGTGSTAILNLPGEVDEPSEAASQSSP